MIYGSNTLIIFENITEEKIMYIDNVIILSLVVIAAIIYMMYYLWKYAKKHIDMDTKKASDSQKENWGYYGKNKDCQS